MNNNKLEHLLIQKCKDHEIHEAEFNQIVEQGLLLFQPMPDYPAPVQPRHPESNCF